MGFQLSRLMHIYFPSPVLAPYIRNYRIVETDAGLMNRVVPDTSMVMALRFKGGVSHVGAGGEIHLPAMAMSGVRRSGRVIHYSGQAGNMLVIFKEGGARAFLREPLHMLFDENVALQDLSGFDDIARIEDELGYAQSHEVRVAQVERFLLDRLKPGKPDVLVTAALEDIHQARGTLRIKALADKLCISQDAFEKRFRRMVGVSPKVFSSIVRMKSILHKGLNEMRLTEAAFDAGYFDQPHFNKDFKLFTGQTPTDFLKSPVYW